MAAGNLNGRRQFKWPHCNLCVAVVCNHTIPIRERRRIRVKVHLSFAFQYSEWHRNNSYQTAKEMKDGKYKEIVI